MECSSVHDPSLKFIDCRMLTFLFVVILFGGVLFYHLYTDTDRLAEEARKNEASKRQADKERDEYWRKQRQEEEDSQWFDD